MRLAPRLWLGHWVGGGARAQRGTTRGNRLPSPPHPPGTSKPSSPSRTGPAGCLLQEVGVGEGAPAAEGVTPQRPVPQEGGDQPRQGPSGFKAPSGLPRERGSASSRLNLPRCSGAAPAPQPEPEAPRPREGRGDPALLTDPGRHPTDLLPQGWDMGLTSFSPHLGCSRVHSPSLPAAAQVSQTRSFPA